jgi:hypothetical protein
MGRKASKKAVEKTPGGAGHDKPNAATPAANARRTAAGSVGKAGAARTVARREAEAVEAYRRAPEGAHEWLSLEDPDELRTWVFDVTFLTSRWRCIYGHGCQGVLTGPAEEMAQGCCSYGAHFTDDEDIARVKAAAKTLPAEDWQFAKAGRTGGVVRRAADGAQVTRLVDGACIFLNRPGFDGGPGCALHRVALGRDQLPMELKPDVCWQLPIRREDSTDESTGRVTTTITELARHHWGDGGAEFHWWCTEAPEAFTAPRPVYETMAAELAAMLGHSVYRQLAAYLKARESAGVPLPHPVVRQRPT